jgi:hypothetical protein
MEERLLLLLAVLNVALVCALLMASFNHWWPFDYWNERAAKADGGGTAMNVQIARGVATITLSEAEVRRFLAQSRVIVDDMRRALREAMEQPGQADPPRSDCDLSRP